MSQAVITDTPYLRKHYLLRGLLGELPTRDAVDTGLTTTSSTAFVTSSAALAGQAKPIPIPTEWIKGGETTFLVPFDVDLNRLVTTSIQPFNFRWDSGHPDAATNSPVISALTDIQSRVIARTLDALIENAKDEHFEDGMYSNLGMGLRVMFRRYSETASEILEERLNKSDIRPRILAEVLHTLGNLEDDATKDRRLATLVGFLKSSSPLIRDAAAVGLSYLDDKRAVPYLSEATERESNEVFREDLRAIIEQLGN